ncbi:MAG: redoxin domain-containing protein [Caldilineales bacterium]
MIGELAASFELADIEGAMHRLADYAGDVVVLDFWSAECPWSQHYDEWLSQQFFGWARAGVHLLAVASNVNETGEFIRATVAKRGITFPVLPDPGSAVADLYGAVTTPHIFVIDPAGRLAYQGAIDDRSFRKREADVNYLDRAIDALLAGRHPDPAVTEPYGCTIARPVDQEGTAA